MRKVVVQANRNAFFYVLDRETGEFLMGKPFARQNWATELDSKGRPILMKDQEPSAEGTRLCPGLAGAANWMAPSYNPETKLFYFAVREQCDVYYTNPAVYIKGRPYWGSVSRGVTDEPELGMLKALDPTDRRDEMELPVLPRTVGGNALYFRRIDFLGRSRWLPHGFRCEDRQGSLASEYGKSDFNVADNVYGEWTAIYHDAFGIGSSDFGTARVEEASRRLALRGTSLWLVRLRQTWGG